MADLGLADAMHSAEPLLDPVRVPREVVVHQQVRPLQVDAFAGGVGGDEDQAVLVLREPLLDDPTFLADRLRRGWRRRPRVGRGRYAACSTR